MYFEYITLLIFTFNLKNSQLQNIDSLNVNIKIQGPGLMPDKIVLPARYIFIKTNITNGGELLKVGVSGITNLKPCRIRTNLLDLKDGSYIFRYKLYENCDKLTINILYNDKHVAESPYQYNNVVADDCKCPVYGVDDFLKLWQCGNVPEQIKKDLNVYKTIDWNRIRNKVIDSFNQPGAISLCHYIIKNNSLYRKCYGKHVGFKTFMDNTLLSILRKTSLPDTEFFVNLGDWPLTSNLKKYPILSWCGSEDSFDIVMPTYDISVSTLENLGRVTLDMLSVQGNIEHAWESRISKAFWRGRDSSRERLKLIEISREQSDLFNVSLTNFFFFRNEQEKYGPKTDHVSFFKFFDYKYQVCLDGTVAAYRLPYLLGGGSLVFKQESKYYEHFYNLLQPYNHYIPIKRDLSDLTEKIQWAKEHDDEAKMIAKNGQKFANNYLLPVNIFCYHVHLIKELSQKQTSPVTVLNEMENVSEKEASINCKCETILKDEL